MITVTDVRSISGDSSFLIDNGNTSILYDTGFAFTGNAVAANVKSILGERKLDFIFLTHSHYDHVLGSVYVKKLYPKAQIVASSYCKKIFEKPTARAVMRELDKKFALSLGISEHEDLIDSLSVDIIVEDGEIFRAGEMKFQAVSLPGHTKCSFGYYLESEKLLLSCETLGVFDGEQNIIPSYLIGYRPTLESIEKAKALDIEKILIPHLGLFEGSTCRYYLENAKKSAVETCREIATILKFGGTRDDAFEHFKKKFYFGSVVDAYPIDAFTLNTNIMIDLITKEILT